jgi:lipopolysaccharide export LptBFGC system permease protein LptF
VLVGAMGFTCAQLVKHREFVAVLAGGLSLFRIARPIVVVATALTLVQLVNRELILPELAPLLTRRKVDAGDHSLGSSHQPLCADSRGRLFYARSFDFDAETIDGLWVWERDERGLMSRRITADSAHWDAQTRRWVLENGLAENRSLDTGDQAQRTPEPVTHLETDLDPIALRLRRFEGYSSNLSTLQLSELLTSYRQEPTPPARQIERLERVRFGRVSGMLCGMLTLALALPFFLRREPVNMLVQALVCAPITIVAFLGTLVGTTAAVPGLPPQVSVFIPAMVLIPLAIAAVSSVKT